MLKEIMKSFPLVLMATILLLTSCTKNKPIERSGNLVDSTANPIDSSGSPVDSSGISPDSSANVVVKSIFPTEGYPNTSIVVKGENFAVAAAENLVRFNGVPATVVSATNDSLIVTVPVYGMTGPVTVTVNAKTAMGPVFTYLDDSLNIYASTFGNGVIYWKNKEMHFLAPVQNSIGGAFAIAVSDTDVYVAGANYNKAGIWKNGIETVLPTSDPNAISKATSIFLSGTDIYIGGSDGYKPVYWKNGVEHQLKLPDPTAGGIVNAIATDGSNVYAAGYLTYSTKYHSAFWKNDEVTILGNQAIIDEGATSIALSGSDVYVCGSDSGRVTYWKNGSRVTLSESPGTTPAATNAIAVSGNDVYVAGSFGSDPVYWKNGEKLVLPYGSFAATAYSIFLYKDLVYIGGADGSSSVYWKNGIEHHLPGGGGDLITDILITKP